MTGLDAIAETSTRVHAARQVLLVTGNIDQLRALVADFEAAVRADEQARADARHVEYVSSQRLMRGLRA